ncbi:MAG: tRNA lysidine(34) synthetase TilS [Chrysiogenales bacterium]|nr:MAG: tRNA lysidine(34) synthetase TilS [Chrysiogenales bacterium]
MDCTDRVRDWIIENGLISRGDRITAAVSGGPDSMAMLSILHELSSGLGFILSAAYLDHQIRKGTQRERRIVERWCGRLGVPLVTGEVDAPALAKQGKIGLEEAAREARHGFLEKFGIVALGHNSDDQVETVLHHIIRGTGIRGLAGMPVRRGAFIRPVMCCTGYELKGHCRARHIGYAIDPSNSDITFFRNRIRHRLLPSLRRDFNPAVDDAVIRLAGNARDGLEALSEGIGRSLPVTADDGSVTIDAAMARDLSDYRLYLLIDSIMRERLGVYRDIGRPHFDSVTGLIRAGRSGKRTALPHGIRVTVEHGAVRFERSEGSSGPMLPPDGILLPGDGDFDLPGWDMTVSVNTIPRQDKSPVRASWKKAELAGLSFPVRVRPRRDGDRLVPFGMKGSKKLSDIMIDAKIPLRSRGAIPVFEDRGGIFWVPGLVIAERTRITRASRKITSLRISGPDRSASSL